MIKEVDVVVHLMEIEVVEGAVEVIHVDPRFLVADHFESNLIN